MVDVEAVRSSLKIEAVLAMSGAIVRPGMKRYPCPLCNTSSRSQAFSVRDARWHCFACGRGGDVIELVGALRGLSWKDAIGVAAELAGVAAGDFSTARGRALRSRAVAREEASKLFRDLCALRDRLWKVSESDGVDDETRETAFYGWVDTNRSIDLMLEEWPIQ